MAHPTNNERIERLKANVMKMMEEVCQLHESSQHMNLRLAQMEDDIRKIEEAICSCIPNTHPPKSNLHQNSINLGECIKKLHESAQHMNLQGCDLLKWKMTYEKSWRPLALAFPSPTS